MRYQDYVIKDGRFVGRFEEMYRDVADPWHCQSQADSWKNALLVGAAAHLPQVRQALDLGCGLGALTARLRRALPQARWRACDVSATAVSKAAAANPEIEFFAHDVTSQPLPLADLDLVTMAEVMWYILPQLEQVLAELYRALAPGGHLLVLQYFLPAEEQRYGKEWVTGPADLIAYVRQAGFTTGPEVYLGKEPPMDLLLVARKSC